MFYLKHWCRIIFDLKLKGITWVLVTGLLTFTLVFRTEWENLWATLRPENVASPYTTLVIQNNENVDATIKTIAKIQGVREVQVLSQKQTSKILSPLISEIGPGYNLESVEDFKRIKILFNKETSETSFLRMKNWLSTNVALEMYTLSGLKLPEGIRSMFEHPFYRQFFKLGPWGGIAVIWLIWVLLFWTSYNQLRAESYLVERYQRKKYVAAKSMAFGIILMIAVVIGSGFYFLQLSILGAALLFTMLSLPWCLTMKTWQWRQQF